MMSRKQLYAMGEPFGDSATRTKPGGRIYGGGGSGGGGPSTSTTTNQIDTRFDPLIDYATQTAGRVNSTGFTPYGGQRYADMNGTQQAGIGMIQDRAMNGNSTVNAGSNYLENQLNSPGQSASVNPYASQSNPYLDAMVQKAQTGVMSNMGALQARSGSFGNSGIAEQGAQQMGKIATDMYGQAYNTQANLAESQAGRNDAMAQNSASNKMGAANLGLQYGNQKYNDASQLMKAGGQIQDQAQQGKDFNYNQFQEQQNQPYKQMAAYSGLLGSSGASASSKTENSGNGGGGK